MSDKWQPIETAPRDGTSILLVDKYKDIKVCSFGESNVFDRKGSWVYGDIFDDYNNMATFDEPIRWMPLPEPPNAP